MIVAKKTQTLPSSQKKKWLSYFIYASVFLAVLTAAVLYSDFKNNQIKEVLGSQILELQEEIERLQSKDLVLENNILEKESRIEGLTGELEKVKVEGREQIDILEDKLKTLKAENRDFSAVIEDVLPAVVSIRTNLGSGSGFLVTSDGYIVTNNHVIEKVTAATITTFENGDHSVRIVGTDKVADIAVLQISGENFDFLSFGNSRSVSVGQRVIALGNPGGLDFTVTEGIISATNRVDSQGNEFLQIDVPINPGNSGGPLVNSDKKVLGVNTKKVIGFEGIGFSLVSNEVRNIVEEIIENDRESLAQS